MPYKETEAATRFALVDGQFRKPDVVFCSNQTFRGWHHELYSGRANIEPSGHRTSTALVSDIITYSNDVISHNNSIYRNKMIS